MKQTISRTIQVCLITVASWWIINPVAIFLSEQQPDDQPIVDLNLSDEQKETLQENILTCYEEYVMSATQKLKQGGFHSAKEYFKALKHTDSLLQNNEVRYLMESRMYLINFRIHGLKEELFQNFYNQVRADQVTRDQIDAARSLVFGEPPESKSVTFSDFSSLFYRLLKSYLFLGLLIIIGSVNRIWRDSWNTTLFDPRDKLKFCLQILVWPIRLGLWLRGNITVRQYTKEPLRALTQKEKEIVSNFVNGMKGYADLRSYYEQKGIVAQRSFLVATLFLVLSVIPVGFASTSVNTSTLVELIVVISEREHPPDFTHGEPRDYCFKVYLCEAPWLIQKNIFYVLVRQAVYIYVQLVLPKVLYLDSTWRPPENLKLLR